MKINWPALIGRHVLVQQRIRDLDREGLWRHELPAVAAAREEVTTLESRTGPLPTEFREFLLAANGWRAFYQWADLFGTKELLGPESTEAETILAALKRAGVLEEVPVATRLLPIAVTRVGQRNLGLGADLFALAVSGSSVGKVYWFGGAELIDTFSGFGEFFASMTEYGEREVARLSTERAASPLFVHQRAER